MKILFSLTYYTPYVSGLTLYVKRLGEALAKNGDKVSILTNLHQRNLRQEEIINNVKIQRAKPLLKISKGFLSIEWIFNSWQQARDSDAIIISLPQFEGVWPALFGKLFGKKIVTIYHCEVKLPDSILNSLIERVLNFSNFITLSLSDTVITYTEDFARSSKLLKPFSNKLKYRQSTPRSISRKINQ